MGFFRNLMQQSEFGRLPRTQRRIVFYSEGRAYWVHLEGILKTFLEHSDIPVCYFSSSEDDPGLALEHPNLRKFATDSHWVRNWCFETIDTEVMVMTMPDLDRYQIKRSKYPVHYVYVHHSLVSSHMAYRPGAFDHFDTVFCAGPHHARELREQERVYDLAPKILVEHGYGRLDTILAESPPPLSHSGRSLNVLIAPSWGEHGIVEAIGHELIGVLLDRGFRVTLRPHPQTVRFSKEPLKKIAEHYAKVDSFELETDVSSTTSLLESDLMITDWSGSAFDYAFGLERPVLFMDVPPKVNNPKYTDVALEPFESSSRSEIGVICAPDSLSTVPDRIEDLLKQSESWREKIRSYRAESVFNVGSSALAGAKWLADRLKANDGAPEA